MKILHISDTHGFHKEEKLNNLIKAEIDKEQVDVICHSGDFSSARRSDGHEYDSFLEWYSELPIKHKILICGNHEILVEGHIEEFDAKCKELNLIHLFNSDIVIDGVVFFGSPVTPWFNNWAFNVKREDLNLYWESIPNDVDVLITHGPPFGIGDFCGYKNKTLVGDLALLEKVIDICKSRDNIFNKGTFNRNLIHQFGHVHEGRGKYEVQEVIPNYIPINASYLDGSYSSVNTFNVFTSIINNDNSPLF